MSDIFLSEALGGIVAKVASHLNGGQVIPGAITIGSDTVYMVPEGAVSPRMRAHEEAHKKQAKRFEPWWMPALGPLRKAREAIGETRFIVEYIREHRRVGYAANKYEREARDAEAGTL